MEKARREAVVALARAIPEVLQALAGRTARGDPKAKRLLESVIRNAKGGGEHVRVFGGYWQAD